MTEEGDNGPPWPLDWVSIRKAEFLYSLDDLASFKSSGLDPFALTIAATISSRCTISSDIRRRIKEDPNSFLDTNSPVHRAIASSIRGSEGGVTLLGLFSCLSSHYSFQSVVHVFAELGKRTRVPDDLSIPVDGWKQLVTTYGEAVCASDFVCLAEGHSALQPQPKSAGSEQPLTHTSATTVVDFLWVCSELASGVQAGPIWSFMGEDAGWAAAMAEWLFGLRFQLKASINGDLLHGNCGDDESQMVTYFQQPGRPCRGEPVKLIPLEPKS